MLEGDSNPSSNLWRAAVHTSMLRSSGCSQEASRVPPGTAPRGFQTADGLGFSYCTLRNACVCLRLSRQDQKRRPDLTQSPFSYADVEGRVPSQLQQHPVGAGPVPAAAASPRKTSLPLSHRWIFLFGFPFCCFYNLFTTFIDVCSISFFKMAFQIGKKSSRGFLSLVLAGKHVWCFEERDFTLVVDFHQWKA